jgi:hypothetical protein
VFFTEYLRSKVRFGCGEWGLSTSPVSSMQRLSRTRSHDACPRPRDGSTQSATEVPRDSHLREPNLKRVRANCFLVGLGSFRQALSPVGDIESTQGQSVRLSFDSRAPTRIKQKNGWPVCVRVHPVVASKLVLTNKLRQVSLIDTYRLRSTIETLRGSKQKRKYVWETRRK